MDFKNKYHFNSIQFNLPALSIYPSLSKLLPEEQIMFLTFSTFPDPTESCESGLFHCTSGECIHDVFLCDGADDCQDSSDETDCNEGMYSFKIV